jgi:acid stress-induced BolA-like protein IbaG/YrbA
MSDHHHHGSASPADVIAALHAALVAAIPSATAEVTGGGGHYSIAITSPVFAGKGTLERQRLVYAAITHLMKGDDAPVHAVDSIQTRVP